MEISVLASGSNGNCCLVEHKDVSLLLDAGKSGREINERLGRLGKYPENLTGILVTHSHHDHIAGVGVLARRYNIPVYITKPTYDEAQFKLGNVTAKIFDRAKSFRIHDLNIKPVQTSHNVYSCGFVIREFGLFTDTGTVTKQISDIFPTLKAVVLESNHDIDMLIHGRYPPYLKQWILSDQGHLSNIAASTLIQSRGENLACVLLGHLSENNNTPELAKKTFETLVHRKVVCNICSRDHETKTWDI